MKASACSGERLSRLEILFLFGTILAMAAAIVSLACTGANPSRRPAPLPNETEAAAGSDEALEDDDVTDADDDSVLFGLDDAGFEMELPMVPLEELAGQQSIEAVSGSWVVENFVYTPQGLDTLQSAEFSEPIILSMRHRRRDAQVLLWTVMESRLSSEQYLDVVAEEWLEKVIRSESMLAAVNAQSSGVPAIEGLAMGQSQLGDRAVLQADVIFSHPTRRKTQQARLLLARQKVGEQSVLIVLGMSARLEDFPALVSELRGFADVTMLNGVDAGLQLNPERKLETIGAEFAMAPLTAWRHPLWQRVSLSIVDAIAIGSLGRPSAPASDPLDERERNEVDDDDLPEAVPPSR